MINSKEDYKSYLESDRLALKQKRKRPRPFIDEVWKFERLLRKVEYYNNCKNFSVYKVYLILLRLRLHKLGIKLGFFIPMNVFGPGLSIAHEGTIIINGGCKIGSNCRIHNCVTIGTNRGEPGAPKIGDNVFIGPGATIFGNIVIADGIAIGANSVVNNSFYEPGIVIAGAPAKKVSIKGTGGLVVRGTDMKYYSDSKHYAVYQ